MTHLEYPTPDDLSKVGKAKYFEKMEKLLSKKAGKKLTIYIADKASLLKDLDNKPFPFFGKVDAKKSPQWAAFLSAEASEGKCICELNPNGTLGLQVKIKNCKKQDELIKIMSAQGLALRFVDKLMKNGKEVGEEEEEDETESNSEKEIIQPFAGTDELSKQAAQLRGSVKLFLDPKTNPKTKASLRTDLRKDVPAFLEKCASIKGVLPSDVQKIREEMEQLWSKWQKQEAEAMEAIENSPELKRAKEIAEQIRQLLSELMTEN